MGWEAETMFLPTEAARSPGLQERALPVVHRSPGLSQRSREDETGSETARPQERRRGPAR